MRVNVRLISSVRVAPSRGLDSELLFIYLSCINDDLEGRRIEIRNSTITKWSRHLENASFHRRSAGKRIFYSQRLRQVT